jgi:hypothetical protein
MDASFIIPTLSGFLGVVVGSGTTIYLERERRRREEHHASRNERKLVYAAFMAGVVRWQHEIVSRHALRFGSGPDPANHPKADDALERFRQDLMPPLFELRMVGTPEVLSCAEDVMSYTYEYQERHEGLDPGYEEPCPRWIALRDAFIEAVRIEILAT